MLLWYSLILFDFGGNYCLWEQMFSTTDADFLVLEQASGFILFNLRKLRQRFAFLSFHSSARIWTEVFRWSVQAFPSWNVLSQRPMAEMKSPGPSTYSQLWFWRVRSALTAPCFGPGQHIMEEDMCSQGLPPGTMKGVSPVACRPLTGPPPTGPQLCPLEHHPGG